MQLSRILPTHAVSIKATLRNLLPTQATGLIPTQCLPGFVEPQRNPVKRLQMFRLTDFLNKQGYRFVFSFSAVDSLLWALLVHLQSLAPGYGLSSISCWTMQSTTHRKETNNPTTFFNHYIKQHYSRLLWKVLIPLSVASIFYRISINNNIYFRSNCPVWVGFTFASFASFLAVLSDARLCDVPQKCPHISHVITSFPGHDELPVVVALAQNQSDAHSVYSRIKP